MWFVDSYYVYMNTIHPSYYHFIILIVDDLEMKHMELRNNYNTYDYFQLEKVKFKNSSLYVCLVINIVFQNHLEH